MRHCDIERPFHGTCLNLTLRMGCSQIANSLCLRYAEKVSNLQSEDTKHKIRLAKDLGIDNGTCAAVVFDVPCEVCDRELVDVTEQQKVDDKHVCSTCLSEADGSYDAWLHQKGYIADNEYAREEYDTYLAQRGYRR